jgi:hypothetical protein
VQSGQVSIWVTVGVAILGIAGVVIGQLINAWREERRLDRDVQREHAQHWLTQRLDSYVDLVVALHDWVGSLRNFVRPTGNVTPPSGLTQRCVEAGESVGRATVRVGLIGSSVAVVRAKEIFQKINILQSRILDGSAVDAVDTLENLEVELVALIALLGVEFDETGVRRDALKGDTKKRT